MLQPDIATKLGDFMDDIVQQAMRKWPNVPACYGWLGLDMRGQWWMRDEQTQSAGPFAKAKGSKLEHAKLISFIHRNYGHDAQGCWFFQNGPQRVYIELEAAPYIWRLQIDHSVTAPTGQAAQVKQAVTDEQGFLYLDTDLGFGLVHSSDILLAANALEAARWPLLSASQASLPAQFGFCLSPQAMQASPSEAHGPQLGCR